MKKKIIAAVIVLVALAALYALIVLEPFNNHEEQVSVGSNISVFSVEKDKIVGIAINTGDSYADLVKNDGVWTFAGEEGVHAIQPKVDGIAYDLSNLYAESIVEENAADLSMYGLSPAVSTVVVRLDDETVRTFFVGNRVQDSNEYYFATDTDKKVYRISAGKGLVLNYKKDELITTSMHEVYKGDISGITLTRNDGMTFTVSQNMESQTEDWVLTSPYVADTDETEIQSKFLNFIVGMTAKEYVKDKTDKEMGLEKPRVHIAISKTDGSVHNFYIGNTDGSKGTYLRDDGVKYAALVDNEVLKLAEVTAFDVMNKNLQMADYYGIKSVTLKGDMDIAFNYQKGSATVNGKSVSDDTSIRLYSAICTLKVNAEAKNKSHGKEFLKVTFDYGTFDYTYTVYEYDNRNYTVTHDGENFFLIRKETYNEWKETVKQWLK